MNTGPPQQTPARIGRYEIVRRIGAGGMAEVFLGRSVGPGGIAKRICIKRIRRDAVADPRALERFSQEARTSFELQHANIVTVFDFGRDGQELFLAMEWIDGCDLAWLLRWLRSEGRRLPPILAAYVAAALAKALAYAHGRGDSRGQPSGVLHRDVTPGNILLSRRGEIFLTDFGIAAALGRAGTPAGTPAYMAPEQARGEPGDARSNLYSLGLVLAEMLLGHRLRSEGGFQAATSPAAVPAFADVPAPIAEVARALLAPVPDARPRSAAEVERALATTIAADVLRAGSSHEHSLALLVEQAAPAHEREESDGNAGPHTEAGVTAADPTVAPPPDLPHPAALPAPRSRSRVAVAAAIAATLLVAALVVALGGMPAPAPVSSPAAAKSTPETAVVPEKNTEKRMSGALAGPESARSNARTGGQTAADSPLPPTRAPVPAGQRREAPAVAGRRPSAPSAQLRVTTPGSWVTVYLDGEKLGDDAGLFRIPAGRHELRVTNPPLRFERSLTITAGPGETLELEFRPRE